MSFTEMNAPEIAGLLSAIAGTEVTPVDGGFRVKETGTCQVDVLRQITTGGSPAPRRTCR
jgi:hypothetical protein